MDTRSKRLLSEQSDAADPGSAAAAKPLSAEEIEVLTRALNEREKKLRILEQQADAAQKKLGSVQLDGAEIMRQFARLNKNIEDLRQRQEIPRSETPSTIAYNPSTPSHGLSAETNNSYAGGIRLRDVVESIPHFDGYNVPISQYVRACKRARDTVPPSAEYDLTKLLVNRLRGRAYLAVEDEACENITQLTDLLIASFGSLKSVDHYRGELSMIQQRRNEHMLDYISRVKTLRSAINDGERKERGILPESVRLEVDKLAMRSFCRGLPWEIRLQLEVLKPASLCETFAAARRIDVEMERGRERENLRTNRPSERPEYQVTCSLCRNPGHTRGDCRVRLRDVTRDREMLHDRNLYNAPCNFSNNSLPPTPGRYPDFSARRPREYQNFDHNRPAPAYQRPQNEIPVCNYCKNPGHELRDCRKRQFNNTRYEREQGNIRAPSSRPDPPREERGLSVRPVQVIDEESPDKSPPSD
ncbi:hypothetical protein KM043_000397 [Ampulex compressa]|nr:hypothetical protein KM043_000397 [Ampulex compressa]